MRNIKLSKLWYSLHSSYWFVPALMALIAIILAFTVLTLDRVGYYSFIEKWGWIYTGGPDGARALLSAVAGSMISVAATAFSITIVALQLAAANFGPRVLRNFMQDTANQVVLGTFISTFIYSILVLRTIRGEDYDVFVPQISVTVGILLAITSIGVLIFFIHHASTIIQASHVIHEVSLDLNRVIHRLFPTQLGQGLPESPRRFSEIPSSFETKAHPMTASSSGYVQAIDDKKLMKIACEYNLLLRIKSRPGKFVVQGSVLVMIWHEESISLTPENFASINKKIDQAFILGRERTEQQDIEFPINQLVEIAMRALSPGINDPFTAVRCIDRLANGLCCLAQKDFPSPYRYDRNSQLRVIAEPVTFADLTDTAFSQIRLYGTKDAAVTVRLLEALAEIATYTRRSKDRSALRYHAETIFHASREDLSVEQDCQKVQEYYLRAMKALDKKSS